MYVYTCIRIHVCTYIHPVQTHSSNILAAVALSTAAFPGKRSRALFTIETNTDMGEGRGEKKGGEGRGEMWKRGMGSVRKHTVKVHAWSSVHRAVPA